LILGQFNFKERPRIKIDVLWGCNSFGKIKASSVELAFIFMLWECFSCVSKLLFINFDVDLVLKQSNILANKKKVDFVEGEDLIPSCS
jgi:hypothetical protein